MMDTTNQMDFNCRITSHFINHRFLDSFLSLTACKLKFRLPTRYGLHRYSPMFMLSMVYAFKQTFKLMLFSVPTAYLTYHFKVIFATFHSKIMSGIRVLHVSSSYVIANLSGLDISVAALSVRKDNIKFRVPSEILYYAVHLPKNASDGIL